MMQQYIKTKEQYKDCILFYRLGDFYEMFFEDAVTASRVLELTLTGRDCGLEERAPMCGVPYHAGETYISKLIEAGYKVAICEQVTLPTKGVKIVEREVVRIVTPGTLIDSSMLNEKQNNYMLSLYKSDNTVGASWVDISTGDVYTTEYSGQNQSSFVNDLLIRVCPSEIITNESAKELPNLKYLRNTPLLNTYDEEYYEFDTAYSTLSNQFESGELINLNLKNKQASVSSAGALIRYLIETQKRSLAHINRIILEENSKYMQLDVNTRRNLELTETIRDRKKKGSLLWLLDKTQTSMGSRVLHSWVDQPLNDEKEINRRLDTVQELSQNRRIQGDIKELLANVYDIERLCGKISYGNLTPRDCIALLNSLKVLPNIKSVLNNCTSQLIKDINADIYNYDEITKLLDTAIIENPPLTLKDGGYIKQGYNKELDEINNISSVGKMWLTELEAREKEETGIKNLKIGFNKVFGYYIEVTKSQLDLVPFRYQRKQTTTNGERYITEELKNIEDKILNAEEKKIDLEQNLFEEIRQILLSNISPLQQTARQIAQLDSLLSLAIVANENNYIKPEINDSIKCIEIIDGRHPVVENLLKGEQFVPNNTMLDSADNRTMIITGPNMAGKSTYMRQVALITLLAHIGSFVPASMAKIAITDRIFTRVGASDDVAFGQSTFMVEMMEVSNILKYATNDSLIILDEVGRGTSTFDGLSIAWSVMEYLSKELKAKTLFATHYHELTELEGSLDGVKNYRISVKEFNNTILFLRKIVRGGTNKSFGIEVASLAGLPKSVITRAKDILHTLEENELNRNSNLIDKSTITKPRENPHTQEIISVLKELNVNALTPLNAFDMIVNLAELAKKE